ncbi:MAG: PAS domain-containing sensor histidine kinase [Kiloniellales bacterium]
MSESAAADLLTLVMQSAPDGVVILDPIPPQAAPDAPQAFRVVAANPTAGELLCGDTLQPGEDLLACAPWLVDSALAARLREAAEKREPLTDELSRPAAIGPRTLRIELFATRGSLLLRIAPAMAQERRARELALRESVQRFKDVAEVATDWIWETDADLRFSHLSPRFREVTGVDPERALGRTRMELGCGNVNLRKWHRHLNDLEARRPFRNFHYSYLTDDGRSVHWTVSGKPLFDDNGEVVGYRSTGTDITVEVARRREVVRAHRRLIDAIECLDDGFVLFDARDRIVLFNSRYREIFPDAPWDRAEGIGFEEKIDLALAAGRVVDPLAATDPQAWRAQRLERHRNPPPHPFEMPLRDGRWYLVSERPTSEGGIVGIFVDITEIKAQEQRLRNAEARQTRTIAALSQAQEKLEQQADELGNLAECYAAEKDRAEAANRAKSSFLASMSHELRTPLNAILGFSEVIRDRVLGPLDKPIYSEYAADIHRSGSHLLDLINDMLDMSKIEAGKWELQLGSFSLEETIEASLRILAQRADEAGVALLRELEPLPLLVADERAMRQVCLNLVANAIKFTPRGGRVTVGARCLDGRISVSVADTGIGIAAKDLPRVGQPFVQVEGSEVELGRGWAQGTGLGLAISRALVEFHGGILAIESTRGEGTKVTFTLPLVEVRREIRQDTVAVR